MADLEKFRKETHEWLAANCPDSMRWPKAATGNNMAGEGLAWGGRKERYDDDPDMKRWLDVMAERGWTAPTWARQYGGGGLSKEEAKVLAAEMAKLRCKPPLIGFGLIGIAAREAKFDIAPMVMGFILGRELEYTFGQTLALAGDDWIRFALTERLGMTTVVLATPVIGLMLGRRMTRFRQRALARDREQSA